MRTVSPSDLAKKKNNIPVIIKVSTKRKPKGESSKATTHKIAKPTEEMVVERPQDIEHKKENIFVSTATVEST